MPPRPPPAHRRATAITPTALFLFLFLSMPPPPLKHILEVSLYATDLTASEAFYTDVLGLSVTSRFEDAIAFRCGEQVILVFDPKRSRSPKRSVPPHGAEGAGHVAFPAPAADVPAWRAHLRSHDVEIESEVSWDAGTSLYFRDPSGNLIELAPPDLWGD